MTPRDATATKERIVAAAFDEFTERGFDGARVDRIADRAGANKSLLYQYFGDKERLFRHVLECKLVELGRISLDPGRVVDVVGDFFDFHAANPWLTRLMQWEALDFGTDPVPEEEERTAHFAERAESLRKAQRSGRVDRSLDPEQTIITLMGIVTFWFACPQIARMISGGDPYTDDALAARRAHVVDIARRILEVR